MTGLIWFVQIVHYPLFDGIGAENFQPYANRHRHLTSLVVAGPMLTEISSSVLLVAFWSRAYTWLLWINLALVIAIWISTALCSIPCHEKLCAGGFIPATHQWLVLSNWSRTCLWTVRSLILAFVICKLLTEAN